MKTTVTALITMLIFGAFFLKTMGLIGHKRSANSDSTEQVAPAATPVRTEKEICEIEDHRHFYCHYLGRLEETKRTVQDATKQPQAGSDLLDQNIVEAARLATEEFQSNINFHLREYRKLTATDIEPSCENVKEFQDCDLIGKPSPAMATPASTADPAATPHPRDSDLQIAPVATPSSAPTDAVATPVNPVNANPSPPPPTAAAAAPTAATSVQPITSTETRPSFDCAKASNDAERSICASTLLSALDKDLNAKYVAAYRASKTARFAERCMNSLKQTQLSWMKQRNGCGSNSDCIKREIENRIDQLRSQDPSCN